jgi:hypothetical protein
MKWGCWMTARGVRPRPWLQRAPGECAYPVAGEGAQVISCCQPVERGDYCAGHRRRMFLRADPAETRALLAFLERHASREVSGAR